MTYHDHAGCHGRLARPCDAFTGGLAARGTRSLWEISSNQLPNLPTKASSMSWSTSFTTCHDCHSDRQDSGPPRIRANQSTTKTPGNRTYNSHSARPALRSFRTFSPPKLFQRLKTSSICQRQRYNTITLTVAEAEESSVPVPPQPVNRCDPVPSVGFPLCPL